MILPETDFLLKFAGRPLLTPIVESTYMKF